jgi:hypothetical protein
MSGDTVCHLMEQLIAVSWRQWASLKDQQSHQPAAMCTQAAGFLMYKSSGCF